MRIRHRYLLQVVIFVILGALCAESYGQVGKWQRIPDSPIAFPVNRHDDVVFINENVGWIINGSKNVFKTVDGGLTWVQHVEEDNSMPFLRSIAMANETRGFIGTVNGGADRVLYETRDGGERWTNISVRIRGSRPRGICGLWAVNDNFIFGVGSFFEGPWFIKSRDGGEMWSSRIISGNARTLIDVYFQNENVGIVVGGTGPNFDGNAIILRTTDGGDSWTEVFQSTRRPGVNGEWGWKISFPTELVGYVSVEYSSSTSLAQPAKVLKTVDGGLTWTELAIPGSTRQAGLQGIGFLTADVGWASGRGTTSMTTDGGITWSQIPAFDEESNPDGGLDGRTNRIFVVNQNLAFAVGKYAYKFDGEIPVFVENEPGLVPEKFRIEQNYPNPFSPSTTIKYSLFDDMNVQIDIRDTLGRTVRRLVSTYQSSGTYSISWDGTNDSGVRMASGMYFYISDIGDSIEMKRMVLLN